MMCKAPIPYRRAAASAVILAAVVGISGCIPTDNSLMRTALYVMALQQASHRALLANRGPVLPDDCQRTDDLYLACRYNALSAFLTPTILRRSALHAAMENRKEIPGGSGANETVASLAPQRGSINAVAASASAVTVSAAGATRGTPDGHL